MNAILVYGRKAGAEDWQEDLLAESCKTAEDVAKVKVAAAKDGYTGFRVTKWDGSAPDFLKAIK